MKIIEKEINIQTGEEIITERDLTEAELKALEEKAEKIAELEVRNKARQALLERLGITEEEAKLLLG